MKKELLRIAAKYAKEVYVHADCNIGTTEFSVIEHVMDDGTPINVLAIRGTDEFLDWWKNFDMRSKSGWKKYCVDSSKEIFRSSEFTKVLISDVPLLICGHSKAGPTAMRIKERAEIQRPYRWDKTYCVAFEPARGLRNNVTLKLENTVILKDPDSVVTKIGWSRFKHPEVDEVIELPNDKWYPSIKDHGMNNMDEFVKNMDREI